MPAFLQHALLAGLPVAALAGALGYLLLLRGQIFTGDALGHVAVTSALGALALGIDLRAGLFAGTVAVAVLLGFLGRISPRDGGTSGGIDRVDDVVIGSVFAWVLGLGVLALAVYTSGTAAAGNGGAGVGVLFGSILGIGPGPAAFTAALALALLAGLVVMARPLVFATLDDAVARARGVPAGVLGVLLLALTGAAAAQATQVVGALLLPGLLAAPAGAAHRLTARPYAGIALSAAISAGSMASGLALSVLFPRLPPSFAVIAVATAVFALSAGSERRSARNSGPPGR